MLEIWGRADSSNTQAVMWLVGELGLPFERYDIGHRFGGLDSPDFLAMNPNGTIPVIRDCGGPALWETGAILRYLATCYAPKQMWPDDPVRRADVDRWAEWAKLSVALRFTAPVFWRVVRTPSAERDEDAIKRAINDLSRSYEIAEKRLMNHKFLVCDTFTLADIQFGHVLFRWFDIKIDRPSFPALQRYYQDLSCRPAFRDHVMISYSALRE